MKVYQLLDEWENLTPTRKKLAIDNLSEVLKYAYEIDEEFSDGILQEIFTLVDRYDENDYFGTEGLDV